MSDRTGYVQVLSYDGSGRLASVADPFGRTLAFTYGANGQIGSFVDPVGRLYTYSYDASNNLTGVTYPDGTSRQYLYESSSLPHALTGLIDENGKRYASWSYASNGMTASSQLANGANAVSVVYHDDGSSTVTNALGVVQANQFGVGYKVPVITSIALQCPVCSGIARAFTYDFYGNRAGETDFAGNATTFAGSDLPYSVVQGANTPEAQTTSYAWEPGYRWLPESIQRGDISTHELYILFFYDARARLLKRYRFVYSNYTWVSHNVWNYSYAPDGVDSNGNALPGPRATASDPLGHATQYTYDAKQNLASIVDPLGNITRFTSYDVDGRPLVMFDPNLVETDLVYDQRGRLTSVTTAGAATLFGYDGAGNLIGITLANGAKFTYGYDDAHRLINVTDNQGNSISYTLDAVGNRTQSDIRDGGGALRYTQARVFDALSRLTTIVGLNGNLTLGYDAASNLTHYQDGRGNATTFAFDALNRVIQAADPLGKTTDYQYDATGVVSGIADPNGHTTAYTRDPQLGTLTTVASPDNGTASYTYDEARNPISRTDGNGGAIQYGYDALNRLTSLQPVNFPSQSIALYYDEPGATNGIGRITRVVDASGNISYNYTPRGRIASETHTVGGNSYTVRYNYDSADQLIGMTYPSGRIVTYSRDSVGRISGATTTLGATTQTLASAIAYAPFGPLTSLTYGNGITLSRSYDTQYRLSSLVAGTTLSRNYQFYGNDDIASINDAASGLQTLNYDPDRRLDASLSPAASLSWSYDGNGNRLTSTAGSSTTTYAIDTASNRLLSFGDGKGTTVTYDADGNTASLGSDTFTYDAFNRLAQAKSGHSTLGTYTYNAFNQRVTKTVGTTTTVYLYDLRGRIIAEINGAKGTTSVEYVYLDAVPLAVIYASGKTAGTYYIEPDHLGTAQVVTNGSGAVAWKASYDPFGAATLTTSTITFNLRLPGQYFDAESGFHYNGSRYYDPQTGRYLQADPLGLQGGLNPYTYVNGNPITYVDPDGRNPVAIISGVIGGVAGAVQAANAGGGWTAANAANIGLGAVTGAVIGASAAITPTEWGPFAAMIAGALGGGGGYLVNYSATWTYDRFQNPNSCAAFEPNWWVAGTQALLGASSGLLGYSSAFGYALNAVEKGSAGAAAVQAGELFGAAASNAAQVVGNDFIPAQNGGFLPQ